INSIIWNWCSGARLGKKNLNLPGIILLLSSVLLYISSIKKFRQYTRYMKFSHTIYCGVFLLINVIVATAQSNTGISQWLTNNDRSQLFRLQPKNIAFTTTAGS